MGTNFNFYKELVYLTFTLRILVFIFSANSSYRLYAELNVDFFMIVILHTLF